MVIDNETIYGDYCLISAWWDECEAVHKVKDNRLQLGDDFEIEKRVENFAIRSNGHVLFEFNRNMNKNIKIKVDLEVVADFSPEKFDVVYQAFIHSLDKSYDNAVQESKIQEMVDAPNVAAAIDQLAKKYGETPESE